MARRLKETSFQKGFGLTLGCLLALLIPVMVLFVLCAGFLLLGMNAPTTFDSVDNRIKTSRR